LPVFIRSSGHSQLEKTCETLEVSVQEFFLQDYVDFHGAGLEEIVSLQCKYLLLIIFMFNAIIETGDF
jgi:hypothetical protein